MHLKDRQHIRSLIKDKDQINKMENEQQLPDARLHQIISFIKSGIRIVGYFCIPFSLVIATVLLVLSELVGIIEELV
tara:strand:- start:3181 stop:3411 length:231 start_codon:yes stop_codon:yes gene_type:complete